MKKSFLPLLLIVLLLLSGCSNNQADIVATATPIPPAESGDPQPEKNPTAAPIGESDATSTVEPTLALEVPSPTEPSAQSADSTALPQPTLFEMPWDNREIFAAGLKDQEEAVLNELNGASVYHLRLQIETLTTVNGQMEMRYSNQESTPLDELYFHLFADQLGGAIDVENVTVNNQPVQAVRDSTALRVPLPASLQPDQELIIAMDFTTTVPVEESTKYNILAYDEEILALAHFYPMVAVYDDEGWHIEASPPHGDETYADMSYYLVQVTAPEDQVIVASGTVIEESESNNLQNKTFVAGPMRDFYLVMSDRFSVVTNTVGETEINSYAPEEYLEGARFALDVTSQALQSFSDRFGPYPYNELDIVSTPTLALGIEYPGIFANALRIYDLDETSSGTPNAIYLETTTAHEAAHQWFYNLVGNDQLNEPWLDEAITQYATWTYFIDRYGEQNAQGFYESLEGRWSRNEFAEIPIGLPAEAYSGIEYGAIVYGRGPIFLNELAESMGQDTFDQFLRDYVETFRWQIATTEEFQALAESHCNCDLSNLFNQWVYAQ